MSGPTSHQQQTMSKVARARLEIGNVKQTAAKMMAMESPQQAKVFAREMEVRIAHAENLVSHADASVQRMRRTGRPVPRPAMHISRSSRARSALSVLLAADSSAARRFVKVGQGAALLTGKRSREASAIDADAPAAVKVKTEPGMMNTANVQNVKAAEGGVSAEGDAKSSAWKVSEKDAERISVGSVKLTMEGIAPLIDFAVKDTGLEISVGTGSCVEFRCPRVFKAVLWLSRFAPSGYDIDPRDAPPSPEMPPESKCRELGGLYAETAVVVADCEGRPEKWAVSDFSVFQILSERARVGTRFFWAQYACSGRAFVEFCSWLGAHKNLFTAATENRRLAFDAARGMFVPPCIRPFRMPMDVRFPRASIPVNQGPSNARMGVLGGQSLGLRQMSSSAQQHGRQRGQYGYPGAMTHQQRLHDRQRMVAFKQLRDKQRQQIQGHPGQQPRSQAAMRQNSVSGAHQSLGHPQSQGQPGGQSRSQAQQMAGQSFPGAGASSASARGQVPPGVHGDLNANPQGPAQAKFDGSRGVHPKAQPGQSQPQMFGLTSAQQQQLLGQTSALLNGSRGGQSAELQAQMAAPFMNDPRSQSGSRSQVGGVQNASLTQARGQGSSASQGMLSLHGQGALRGSSDAHMHGGQFSSAPSLNAQSQAHLMAQAQGLNRGQVSGIGAAQAALDSSQLGGQSTSALLDQQRSSQFPGKPPVGGGLMPGVGQHGLSSRSGTQPGHSRAPSQSPPQMQQHLTAGRQRKSDGLGTAGDMLSDLGVQSQALSATQSLSQAATETPVSLSGTHGKPGSLSQQSSGQQAGMAFKSGENQVLQASRSQMRTQAQIQGLKQAAKQTLGQSQAHAQAQAQAQAHAAHAQAQAQARARVSQPLLGSQSQQQGLSDVQAQLQDSGNLTAGIGNSQPRSLPSGASPVGMPTTGQQGRSIPGASSQTVLQSQLLSQGQAGSQKTLQQLQQQSHQFQQARLHLQQQQQQQQLQPQQLQVFHQRQELEKLIHRQRMQQVSQPGFQAHSALQSQLQQQLQQQQQASGRENHHNPQQMSHRGPTQ